MEGTKYAQHNQSNNITCISPLSHIGQNYARMETVPLLFSIEY